MDFLVGASLVDNDTQGVYTLRDFKRGELVVNYHEFPMKVIDETTFQRLCSEGDAIIRNTATRLIGDLFLVSKLKKIHKKKWPFIHIQHSFKPNLVHFLGFCFALHDINRGDEITLDYSLFLPEVDSKGIKRAFYKDPITSESVYGMSAKDSFDRSVEQIRALLFNDSI